MLSRFAPDFRDYWRPLGAVVSPYGRSAPGRITQAPTAIASTGVGGWWARTALSRAGEEAARCWCDGVGLAAAAGVPGAVVSQSVELDVLVVVALLCMIGSPCRLPCCVSVVAARWRNGVVVRRRRGAALMVDHGGEGGPVVALVADDEVGDGVVLAASTRSRGPSGRLERNGPATPAMLMMSAWRAARPRTRLAVPATMTGR
jgi:hypothetical protein